MAKTEVEIHKQKRRALWLFGIISLILLASVFGLVVFQFGLLGRTAASPTQPIAASTSKGGTAQIPTASPAQPAPSTNTGGTQPTEKSPAEWESTYLTWVFASLIGICLYLLMHIANLYPKIRDDKTDFIAYTYWYLLNLFRGPVLAMVLLWILTNIQINLGTSTGGQDTVTGVGVVFKDLPDVVLIAVAFILGYYARVSLNEMDIIVKSFFPKAWGLADEDKKNIFQVVGPATGTLLLNDQYTFRTDPSSDVIWTLTVGTIDAETGAYKAPVCLDDDDKHVNIQAALRSDPTKKASKQIVLKLMGISGLTEAKPNEDVKLTITTKLSNVLTENELKKVRWSSDHVDLKMGTGSGKEITITTPDVHDKTTIKITASLTLQSNKKVTAETNIQVQPS